MPSHTTYLQLHDRMSQVWLNRYTLLLLIALVKLLLFSRSLKTALDSSEAYVLSSCDTIDRYYSRFVGSTPHYMGTLGNYMITKAMEESVEASLKTLSLLVYASEELVKFMIELWIGTYACLMVSAIDGAVDVATNTTETLIDFVNGTVSGLANDINGGLGDLSDVVNKVLKTASKVEDLFSSGDDDGDGVEATFKSVNLTIASLRDLQIPSSIDTKLAALSEKTPDFSAVKNKTRSLISVPFEKVRAKIDTASASQLVGNQNLLYVPPLSHAGEGLCSSNTDEISAFYAGLSRALNTGTIVFAVLLAVGALVFLVPAAWSEYRQWKRLCILQEHYGHDAVDNNDNEGKNECASGSGTLQPPTRDIVESYQHAYHRYPTMFGEWLASRLSSNAGTQRDIQWCVSYVTSPRALTILGVALAGIVVCILQFIVLRLVKNALTSDATTSHAAAIASGVNSTLNGGMARWTAGTNDYINATESSMNKEIFGWVETTTEALNGTVSALVEDIDAVLVKAFNGTILYNPAKTVVGCVIGNKLQGVERALTWVHDKAEFSLPRVNETAVLSLAASSSNSTDGPDTSLADELGARMRNGVLAVLAQYRQLVVTELIVACAILAVWTLQIPIAVSQSLFARLARTAGHPRISPPVAIAANPFADTCVHNGGPLR